jgi:hypothetical protein
MIGTASQVNRTRACAGLVLLVTLLLAGCGDFPRPFQGNPGAVARRLAQPPPARLTVPPPPDALLGDSQAVDLAADLARALQQVEVPAVATDDLSGQALPGDWRLAVTSQLRDHDVVPRFLLQNPRGEEQGRLDGAPVPARDWQAGAPATLRAVAEQAAPAIASLLTAIEARRQHADPNSLMNRPARVFVPPVTGAPGDGDAMLTAQLRRKLPGLGDTVQTTPEGADYTVTGTVTLTPPLQGEQRVEIAWTVDDAAGAECGRVTQINQVPAGTLDHYWGDVAIAVTDQAAGGVHEVISNRVIGRVK